MPSSSVQAEGDVAVLHDVEPEPRLLDHVLADARGPTSSSSRFRAPRPRRGSRAAPRPGGPRPHRRRAPASRPAATAAFIRTWQLVGLAEHDHARELHPVAERADQLEREDVHVAGPRARGRRDAELPADRAVVRRLGVHREEERVLAAERVAALVHRRAELALGDAWPHELEQALEARLGDPRRLAQRPRCSSSLLRARTRSNASLGVDELAPRGTPRAAPGSPRPSSPAPARRCRSARAARARPATPAGPVLRSRA